MRKKYIPAPLYDATKSSDELRLWITTYSDLEKTFINYTNELLKILSEQETAIRLDKVIDMMNKKIQSVEMICDDYDRFVIIVDTLSTDLVELQKLKTNTTEEESKSGYWKKQILPITAWRLLTRNGGVL